MGVRYGKGRMMLCCEMLKQKDDVARISEASRLTLFGGD